MQRAGVRRLTPALDPPPPDARARVKQPQHQQMAFALQQSQQLQAQHQAQLRQFWQAQQQEIENVTDFKNHQMSINLPLARIKKIMKSDEDVRMISSEAPVLFAKACEMFILELTLRSWIHSEENKRRTLQRNDIAAAITKTDIFDFLVDIVPRDDFKDDSLARPGQPVPGQDPAQMYQGLYYVPQQAVPQVLAPAQLTAFHQMPQGSMPPVSMPGGMQLGSAAPRPPQQ